MRNWHAWKRLGIGEVNCPGTCHRAVMLYFRVSIGSVEFSNGLDDLIIVSIPRSPWIIALVI
jgi:hypothetical protein